MSGRVYRQAVPIDFGDADIAGILYFPRLFHLCHVSMEGFVKEALGLHYAELLKDRNLGFPTVRTEGEWRQPLPYGHDLDVAMTLRKLGRKSIDFRWQFRVVGEDALRSEARSTTVCVRMDHFKSVTIPDDIRVAFEPYLEDGADA